MIATWHQAGSKRLATGVRPRLLLATLAIAPLLIATAACGGAGGGGRVAFTSSRDGNPEVYSARSDGEDPQRLTNTASAESNPAWSPNRQQIAFLSDRNGLNDLWIMDLEGESEQRAVEAGGKRNQFAWAPDSKRIAYTSDQDGDIDVYVVDLEKNQQIRLTDFPGEEDLGGWSPNGEWVVFGVRTGDAQGIHKKNPLGVDEIQLTEKPDFSPQWAPRGDQIAFLSERDGDLEIYVMGLDGQEETNLSKKPGPDLDFDWSPDGRRIAFISERDGNAEVYVASLEGEVTRLTRNTVEERNPRWSPSGGRIIFASKADGDFDLYTMRSDGSDQQRVTATEAEDLGPDW